jgi:hypothetical protein
MHVFGAGRYRKHFIVGKDVGDMWAMSMQESIAAVLLRVKHIGAMIRSTENVTCKNLKIICSEVTASQLPPNAVCVESGICAVTRSKSSVCINLGGQTRAASSTNLLIHPSLFHFFVMVWFVHKIEHVIRNYTRWWLEQMTDKGENIEQLCHEFSADTTLFTQLHTIFNHAVSHIEQSVEEYQE